MPHDTSHDTPPSPLEGPKQYIHIDRPRFDAVPRKRALYIAAYVVAFLCWVAIAINSMIILSEIESEPATESAPIETDIPTETATPSEIDAPPEAAEPPAPVAYSEPDWAQNLRVVILTCLLIFYVPFISVLRTMGYPITGILAMSIFSAVPIPGLFVVAYIDTRIAKTWNNANDAIRYAEHDAADSDD